MAAKRKTKKEEIIPVEQEIAPELSPKTELNTKESKSEPEKIKKESKKVEREPKYKIGSIVFISKDADADLNGFKLFPQYKKYTYTVEAYDEKSDVYTLRRLNLSLRLKGRFILAPDERAHDSLNRKQF